jgi:hypothetical protein
MADEMTPGERLEAALEMWEDGMELMRANLRRRMPNASTDEIEAALDAFCERGLMMRDGTLFLSLALPASRGR